MNAPSIIIHRAAELIRMSRKVEIMNPVRYITGIKSKPNRKDGHAHK